MLSIVKKTKGVFKETKPRLIKFWTVCPKFYQGFTLLEILIAVFIIGIIMTAVLGTFTGIIASARDAEKKIELYQTGRVLMDIICTDVRCMFEQRLKEENTFFLGSMETIDGLSASKMDFITSNSLHIGQQRNPFLSEVGYRVKKNQNEELYTLWRRSQSPMEFPYGEGGREVPICRMIESFRLEFIQKGDKLQSLDNSLPTAIMIHITLNLDGERENFVTMVRPMVTPLKWRSSASNPPEAD